MRVATVTVLVVAVLAAAAPVAVAQDSISRAANELPAQLFEPPPDGVPTGARGIDDGGTRSSITLAIALLAAAAVVGYFAGSSSRTSRS
jgi:hypothetical protein